MDDRMSIISRTLQPFVARERGAKSLETRAIVTAAFVENAADCRLGGQE